MGRLFGTDGVRGVAGSELTAAFTLDLAIAAAQILAPASDPARGEDEKDRRPVAVVGRDPRASGEFLEAAVVAGLTSSGVDVLRLGVLPTPGVAYLTKALDADFGVVLSASHNPARDNGIKFFARGGRKLPDQVEDQIEAVLGQPAPAPRHGFGRAIEAEAEQEKYLDHLVASLGSGPIPAQPPLAGLRVVVDCAHGAAYAIAPEALRRAGAEVIAIGVEPDGDNINAGCGSTHLDTVASVVRAQAADVGIAHDGDADRCLAVDADGQIVDGDQILAVLATELKQEGRLAGDTVVVTVMSNLGFRLAMDDAGIAVAETPVGDRYVLEAMLAGQHNLGGEQSGHIILADYATTGDGVLTALHLLAVLARRGVSLAEAAKVMTRYPQVLINVPGDKERAATSPELAAAVQEAERALGSSGRILVRPSGTEPITRVMVEAVDTVEADRIAHQVADTIRRALA